MTKPTHRPRGRPRVHPLPDPDEPRRGRGRPRKDGSPAQAVLSRAISRGPVVAEIEALQVELAGDGYVVPAEAWLFRDWLREQAERDLFFFAKWIFYQEPERRAKLGAIHRELCRFVTDYSTTRRKLALMPMGHLKTSHCSQALPLHVLIQKPETNIYFPGVWG